MRWANPSVRPGGPPNARYSGATRGASAGVALSIASGPFELVMKL